MEHQQADDLSFPSLEVIDIPSFEEFPKLATDDVELIVDGMKPLKGPRSLEALYESIKTVEYNAELTETIGDAVTESSDSYSFDKTPDFSPPRPLRGPGSVSLASTTSLPLNTSSSSRPALLREFDSVQIDQETIGSPNSITNATASMASSRLASDLVQLDQKSIGKVRMRLACAGNEIVPNNRGQELVCPNPLWMFLTVGVRDSGFKLLFIFLLIIRLYVL